MVAANIAAADEKGISEAARILRAGGLVAFPTETVYGLGADARNGNAVARIFEAKQRPQFNPLIVHLPDVAAARLHGVFDDGAEKLAAAFWPGPLTLVLTRTASTPISNLASAGGETIALRVPGHSVAQALLVAAACPVAAPSANRSGRVSPTNAAHVAASLGGRVDLILDGGACPGGLESTIIDLAGECPALLRPGLITRDAVEEQIGPVVLPDERAGVRAPGMLPSHYAPEARLRLDADAPGEGEAWLGFGGGLAMTGVPSRNLSPSGDLVEAAANLFAMLHDLDSSGMSGIAVAPIPEEGLGIPINDRLRRAAAPRD